MKLASNRHRAAHPRVFKDAQQAELLHPAREASSPLPETSCRCTSLAS